MDGKQTGRNLLWALLVFFAWLYVARLIWPTPPASTTQPAETTTQSTASAPQSAPATGQAAQTRPTATAAGGLIVRGGEPGESIRLGSTAGFDASSFPMEIEIQRRGAGIANVWLSRHFETALKTEPYHLLTPVEMGQAGPLLSLATERLHLAPGGDVELADIDWQIVEAEPQRAVFAVDVLDGSGQPLARAIKTYELSREAPDRRYDVRASVRIENLSAAPLEAILTQRGPVGIRREDQRTDERAFYVGYLSEGRVNVERFAFANASAQKVISGPGTALNLAWAALSDKYFTAIVAPVNADLELNPDVVRETKLVKLGQDTTEHEDLSFRLISRPMTIAPGEADGLLLDCYLGPKSREAFVKHVPQYRARNYYGQIEASYKLGCCSFLTFSWLIDLMISLLNTLHAAVHNFGVAIIILVLVVRTLLHPITKKAQVNMVRMQKQMAFLAPKLEEVKKRHGHDKVKLQQETMKVYAEAGVNPAAQMLNMLPMLLQTPIWIALYSSLNVNIAMRHEGFILWIRDLTGPDALVTFAQPQNVPILSWLIGPLHSLNVLPILLSIAFVVQQKLMPKAPKPQGEPTPAQLQQEQMQKMMPFMSVMFGLFLYNAPSGLTLYIMSSTIFGTLEQWFIRRHIKRDEERGRFEFKPPDKPKRPRKPSFFEKLQQAAAEAQRQKSRRER